MSIFFGINKEVLPLKVNCTVALESIQFLFCTDFLASHLSSFCVYLLCVERKWRLSVKYLFFQANLTIQEAKLNVAQNDLNEAQAQLDEKQAELDKVQAMYDKAVQEKQVKLVDHRLSLFQGTIFKRVKQTLGSKKSWIPSGPFGKELSYFMLAGGHFLLVFVSDFVSWWFDWTLSHWTRKREELLVPNHRMVFLSSLEIFYVIKCREPSFCPENSTNDTIVR